MKREKPCAAISRLRGSRVGMVRPGPLHLAETGDVRSAPGRSRVASGAGPARPAPARHGLTGAVGRGPCGAVAARARRGGRSLCGGGAGGYNGAMYTLTPADQEWFEQELARRREQVYAILLDPRYAAHFE